MNEICLPYSEQLQLLRNELEKAWRGRTDAIADFDSMIPTPDGSFRILWPAALRNPRNASRRDRGRLSRGSFLREP